MAKGDAPGETADDGKGKAADQKPDDKTGTKPEDNSAVDESTKPEPKAADKGTKAEDKTFTQAEFDRELAKQKKEFEKAAQKEKERADLSEAEKKDAELDDLRTQLRLRDAKDDVVAALEKEGARSTGLMWNAIKSDLEFDDKGKLVNLTTLIKDLRADYRYLQRDADGDLYLYNAYFFAAEDAPKGLAKISFPRQAFKAQEYGIKYIKTEAAGDYSTANRDEEPVNGYYTWARFGYNGPLSPEERKFFQSRIDTKRKIYDINDLMRAGGKDLWLRHGSGRLMVFRLDGRAKSMRILKDYVRENARK